jgi:MOSC domain-containing protein YiiM
MLDPMKLSENQAGTGSVEWIGVRPARRARVEPVEAVLALHEVGLRGDHFAGKPGSDRQVTLVQHEHLAVIASLMGQPSLDPGLLRRNISVRGINLLSLVGRKFRAGDAILEGAGPCRPCSRMEENLGHGGWNAMRGHGGIIARVVQSGLIQVGDAVADLGAASSVGSDQSDDNS